MPFPMPSHPSLTHLRSFTCTARSLAKSTKQRLKYEHTSVPTYPYGPSQFYKQSNFGLYGTQKIRYGNMVSEKNEIKTRRYWRPNVHSKRIWSDALQRFIRTRVTTRVLRTIDKVGGLDEYILGEKASRIKELGMGGWKLRWRIMQTEAVKERFRKQREEMGVSQEEDLLNSAGNLATREQVQAEVEQIDKDLLDGEVVEIGEDIEVPTEERGFMEEQPSKQGKVLL